jgi:hypothetical protein
LDAEGLLAVVLPGILLPAVLCCIAMLMAWRPWQRSGAARMGLWGGPLGLGLGYLSAQLAVVGWPPFPAVESTQWLFHLVVAATILGVLFSFWRAPGGAVWTVRLLLVGALLGSSLKTPLTYSWGPGTATIWLAGLGVGMLALWDGMERLVARLPGPALPLALCVVAGIAALLLGMSASVLLGQLAGGLAAALAVSSAVAVWQPAVSFARGTTPVVVVVLCGLSLNGYFYAELDWLGALLVPLSPLVVWIARVRPLRQLNPVPRAVVAATAAFLVLTPAIVTTTIRFLSRAEPYL